MNKSVLMHIYDHSTFFKKWINHTKGTSILAFTTSYERSQISFSYFLKLVEMGIGSTGDVITVQSIRTNKAFMEKLNELVTNHIPRVDMNNYLLSIKFFRQCLMEMIAESGIKEHTTVMMNVGKVFDVIELTIAEVFYIAALRTLKEMFDQVNNTPDNKPVTRSLLNTLTKSEYSLCELIVANLASKEIADKLNISIGTVNTHRKRIRSKLGIPRNQSIYSHLKHIL